MMMHDVTVLPYTLYMAPLIDFKILLSLISYIFIDIGLEYENMNIVQQILQSSNI